MPDDNPLRIYVASSWRNEKQPTVVKALRDLGHKVYDFKEPTTAFSWRQIDPNWESWTPEHYRNCLTHPLAEAGFNQDFLAMWQADVFVGVLPFGRSAALEMGWAAGKGIPTILLLEDGEPELMVKLLDHLCLTLDEVVTLLNTVCRAKTKDKVRQQQLTNS